MDHLEIKQLSEKEFLIGDNKTVVIDKKIINVIPVGEQTDEIASLQKELMLTLCSLADWKLNLLIDVNRSGKSSPKARQTWNELAKNDKINKTAVFGLHPVARVLASFVIGLSIKNNQRFFKTEEEAREWLLKADKD